MKRDGKLARSQGSVHLSGSPGTAQLLAREQGAEGTAASANQSAHNDMEILPVTTSRHNLVTLGGTQCDEGLTALLTTLPRLRNSYKGSRESRSWPVFPGED
jgi:hypothetical protein